MSRNAIAIRELQPEDCLRTLCYQRADTAFLSQLAVETAMQSRGLGKRLMDEAEAWVASQGFAHIALDTAGPAEHLRHRYTKRGYAGVGTLRWEGKTHDRGQMVKPLHGAVA